MTTTDIQTAPATIDGTWTLDPDHTLVEFGVKHMMFTTVKGHFPGVTGSFTIDPENPANSTVSVVIDVASVETREEKRNAHLRSADFFDVENHPMMTFESTRVEFHKKDHATIYGNLTIRGVTREVALDAEFNGIGVSPWGTQVASFSAKTEIDRKDFGLTWNTALETGGVLVGDKIKIVIEVEATK